MLVNNREKSLARRKSLEVDGNAFVGSLVEIDPAIIWAIKVAMFDTRVDDAQSLLRQHYSSNIWAMSLFCESAVVEYSIQPDKKQVDEEGIVQRLQLGLAQAGALIKMTAKQKDEKRLEALSMEAHAFLCYGFFMVQAKSYVR